MNFFLIYFERPKQFNLSLERTEFEEDKFDLKSFVNKLFYLFQSFPYVPKGSWGYFSLFF